MKNFFILIALIVLGISSCYKESDYTQPLSPSLIQLTTSNNTILADSFSTSIIFVRIPKESSDSFSTVTFKTSAGVFTDNNQNSIATKAKEIIDSNYKIAQVILRSSLIVQKAVVSVELFNVKQSIDIDFTRSYPEDIQLSSSSLSVKPSNDATGELTLNAVGTKSLGYASIGDTINTVAYDSLFINRIGSFRIYNNKTNSTGSASFTFVLGDSVANNSAKPYVGPLFIVSKSLDASSNKYLSDTIKIISSK